MNGDSPLEVVPIDDSVPDAYKWVLAVQPGESKKHNSIEEPAVHSEKSQNIDLKWFNLFSITYHRPAQRRVPAYSKSRARRLNIVFEITRP